MKEFFTSFGGKNTRYQDAEELFLQKYIYAKIEYKINSELKMGDFSIYDVLIKYGFKGIKGNYNDDMTKEIMELIKQNHEVRDFLKGIRIFIYENMIVFQKKHLEYRYCFR